jgi:hypothetical protein
MQFIIQKYYKVFNGVDKGDRGLPECILIDQYCNVYRYLEQLLSRYQEPLVILISVCLGITIPP